MYRNRDLSDRKPIWQRNQPEAPLHGVEGLGGAGSQPEDLPFRPSGIGRRTGQHLAGPRAGLSEFGDKVRSPASGAPTLFCAPRSWRWGSLGSAGMLS